RAAFHVGAADLILEEAVGDGQAVDLAEIGAMRLPVAGAVMHEGRAGDRDVAAGDPAAQDAVLIVVKIAVLDREIAGLVADTGAIAVIDLRAREFETVDRQV